MSRPRTELDSKDLAQVTKLAELGCTDEEMASVIGISFSTWKRIKARDERLPQAVAEGKANLNVKLRRYQIEMAMSGSVPMLIHLGKYMLGQNDKAVSNEKPESPLSQFLPRAETIKQLPKSSDED